MILALNVLLNKNSSRSHRLACVGAVALLFVLVASSGCGPSQKVETLANPLFFKVTGSGEPALVFFHGMLGSHRYWDRYQADLSRTNQILAFDLLGFGESAKPQISYSVDQHIEKIDEAINLAKLKSSKKILIGHSMGALLTLNYAIKFPDEVKGLILINTPMATTKSELRESVATSSSKFMVTMTFNEVWGKFVCKLHEIFPSASYPLIRLLEPEIPAAIAKAAGQHTWASFHGSFQNVLIGQNFFELLASAPEIPILIIASTNDEYTKLSALDKLPKRKSISTVVINGNHHMPLGETSAVLKEIHSFVEKLK